MGETTSSDRERSISWKDFMAGFSRNYKIDQIEAPDLWPSIPLASGIDLLIITRRV